MNPTHKGLTYATCPTCSYEASKTKSRAKRMEISLRHAEAVKAGQSEIPTQDETMARLLENFARNTGRR